MKCVIVDDEPLAIDVIKEYCERVDFLELVGVYTNALDAHIAIGGTDVDLIFSDIEMPQLNGIDFINSLSRKPLFIFTTAYAHYALDGFELNAVDYLMKPIPYFRFIKAVLRAKDIHETKKVMNANPNFTPAMGKPMAESPKVIFVKSDYENIKIEVEQIKYIQGLKDYLKIHLIDTNKPVITLSNFKDIGDKLPAHFMRIHRSFLINIHHIKTVQKTKVLVDRERIPIGDSYKKVFMDRLGL